MNEARLGWRERVVPFQACKSGKIAVRRAEREPMFDCQSGKVSVGYQIAMYTALGKQGREHAGMAFRW